MHYLHYLLQLIVLILHISCFAAVIWHLNFPNQSIQFEMLHKSIAGVCDDVVTVKVSWYMKLNTMNKRKKEERQYIWSTQICLSSLWATFGLPYILCFWAT